MTLEEAELKLAQLQAEIEALYHKVLRLKSLEVNPGITVIGPIKVDVGFAEAVQVGNEYRELVNRVSLEASAT